MRLSSHLSFSRMACCTFHNVIELVLCFHCLTEGPLPAEKNILCIYTGITVLFTLSFDFILGTFEYSCPELWSSLLYIRFLFVIFYHQSSLCFRTTGTYTNIFYLSNELDSDKHVQYTVTKRPSTVVPLSQNILLERECNPHHSCGPHISFISE